MSDFYEQKTEVVGYKKAEALQIKFSTGGLLSTPPILHVTDYTMEDVLKLSVVSPEDIIRELIEIIQARVQENFDIRLMHENEFEEMLLTMYANFWSSKMIEYPFPFIEKDLEGLNEEEANKIRLGQKRLTIDLNLTSVIMDELQEDFKEPIIITTPEGWKLGFRLLRIGDYIEAEDHLLKVYAVLDKKYADIKLLESDDKSTTNIDPSRMMDYRKYIKKRAADYIRIMQALLIVSINDKELKTIEEKLEIYKDTNKKIWLMYNKFIKKIKFGVNHMVKMTSPITKKKVTRRCLFQILEFIPSNELYDDTGYVISFGDGISHP